MYKTIDGETKVTISDGLNELELKLKDHVVITTGGRTYDGIIREFEINSISITCKNKPNIDQTEGCYIIPYRSIKAINKK